MHSIMLTDLGPIKNESQNKRNRIEKIPKLNSAVE